MKTALVVLISLCVLSAACTAVIGADVPAANASDRLTDKQEAFGLASRFQKAEQDAKIVEAAPTPPTAGQAASKPVAIEIEETKSAGATTKAVEEKPTASEAKRTDPPKRSRPSAAKAAGQTTAAPAGLSNPQPGRQSGVVSDATPGRTDKIALMAQADGARRRPAEKDSAAHVVLMTLVKLGLVLVLAYVTILALKMLSNKRETGSQGSSANLRVMDTIRLSPGSSLHLIDAKGKMLLVGCSSGQVNVLREFDAEEQAETPGNADGKFAQYLEKYSAGYDSGAPSGRIAGLLRDCTAYLRGRYSGTPRQNGYAVGENDEA